MFLALFQSWGRRLTAFLLLHWLFVALDKPLAIICGLTFVLALSPPSPTEVSCIGGTDPSEQGKKRAASLGPSALLGSGLV